jgi:hypothetical protein
MSTTLEEETATPNGSGPVTENLPKPRRGARSAASAAAVKPGTDDDGVPRLVIKPIQTETLAIQVVGEAPLIVSRFSDKAKRQMLEAQQGIKRPKESRNPEQEFQDSLYKAGLASAHDAAVLGWSDPEIIDPETGLPYRWSVAEGGQLYGLPSMSFKMCTIAAARLYGKAVKMTELRQFMYFDGRQVIGEPNRLTIIQGTPALREDYVRLAGVNRPADLRYRGCFYEWRAVLIVRYTRNLLDRDSLISLIDAGGTTVGVGEWRPERDGEFGTFHVADGDGAITVLRTAGAPVLAQPGE